MLQYTLIREQYSYPIKIYKDKQSLYCSLYFFSCPNMNLTHWQQKIILLRITLHPYTQQREQVPYLTRGTTAPCSLSIYFFSIRASSTGHDFIESSKSSALCTSLSS